MFFKRTQKIRKMKMNTKSTRETKTNIVLYIIRIKTTDTKITKKYTIYFIIRILYWNFSKLFISIIANIVYVNR